MKEFVPFMRHNFTDAELTNYERQGRKQIVNSIGQMGIIEHAQESAAKQLIPMLKMLGYKQENITISFPKAVYNGWYYTIYWKFNYSEQ